MKKRPVLTTEEAGKSTGNPVLVIDRKGRLGKLLSEELAKDFLVVYASEEKIKHLKSIIHIPYRKKILKIPDNIFSHIFLVLTDVQKESDLLIPLIKKAKATNARLIIILISTTKESSVSEIERYNSAYPFSLCVIGDIYGDGLGRIDEHLEDVQRTGKITLLNDGLEETFPVFIYDVVYAVIKATFSTDNAKHTFLLLPHHSTTELGIARAVIKVFPEVIMQYKKQKSTKLKRFIPSGEYVLDEAHLEDNLKTLLSLDKKNTSPKERKKKSSSKFKLLVFLVLALFLTPFIVTGLFAGLGVVVAKNAEKEARSGNFTTSEKQFSIAKNTFTLAGETGQSVKKVLSLTGFKTKGDELLSLLKSGETVTEAGEEVMGAALRYQRVLVSTSLDPGKDVQEGSGKLRRALALIQKLETEKTTPKEIREKIKENKELLSLANSISSVLPDLLGVTEDKKYLLLFQNNMELRPGGGFIGSYGMLPVKKGRIGKITINDVYDADGQLKGHVEPPFALRRFAGIKHWYLRDSNFNVDFEENAKKAIYFLDLETGEEVDGVLAIDTDVLKNILKLTGPVFLPTYKQTVTNKNIVMLTQVESQDNFFPGSTQKKDFLKALQEQLLKKIADKKDISYEEVLRVLQTNLKEKHILFVAKDPDTQKVITSANISGKLAIDEKRPGEINDYLYINEANIGGTKGNQYLKRDITQSVRLKEEKGREEEIILSYNNTSTTSSKYGGEYLGYLQFVVPEGAVVRSIRVDGIQVSLTPAVMDPEVYEDRNFKQQEGIELASETVGDKSIFAFAFTVPVMTKKEIIITYDYNAEEKNRSIYSLTAIKQPGTSNDPYLLRIYYPQGKKPTKLLGLTDKFSWAEYKGNLSMDAKVQISFDK